MTLQSYVIMRSGSSYILNVRVAVDLSSLELLLRKGQEHSTRTTEKQLRREGRAPGKGCTFDESARWCCDLLVIFGHERDAGFYFVIFFQKLGNQLLLVCSAEYCLQGTVFWSSHLKVYVVKLERDHR